MDCGFGSPEEIASCIYFIKRWFQVIVDIAGLGTFALISILTWFLTRLRKDLARWEEDASRERDLRHYAEEAKTQVEHRADFAEKEAERARRAIEELKATAQASEDELRNNAIRVQAQLSEVTARLDSAIESTAGGTGKFWSRPVGSRLADYERLMAESIPSLIFANQKGGVGKSTTVTNLAAAFAARGERVLTVDLDYQGSHSSLVQLQLDQGDKPPESLIDGLFEEALDTNWAKLTIRKISDKLFYIPAFYSFETIERRVEYQWTLGSVKDDVRYRLARALLSRDVQDNFDRILIDAPPRFTLGFVNGFCAATHLYVPTIVDLLSASAVGSFARQFRELRPVVNPHIQWAGIIGTMTFRNPQDPLKLPATANEAADAAEREAQLRLDTRDALFIRKPVITRDADLARATERGIAYLNDSRVRPMFDALADVIETKAPRRLRIGNP